MTNRRDHMDSIRDLIGRSCMLLDDERFDQWLELCAPEMRYTIETYSPEIRREMTWLNLDRTGLAQLFGTLRHHERDPGTLVRHPSILDLKIDADGLRANAMTSVMIARTAADGATGLFAVARYYDIFSTMGASPLLAARRVQLFTRILMSDSGGSHLPL